MTSNIFVSSLAGYSGKTAVVLGLSLALQEQGREGGMKIGYFKPFANQITHEDGRPTDDDVLLMQQALKMDFDYETIAPITLEPYDFSKVLLEMGEEQAWEKISSAFAKIQEKSDIVIVEGLSDPFRGICINLSAPVLAKNLECNLLVVLKPNVSTPWRNIDYVCGMGEFFKHHGVKMSGAILNQAPAKVMPDLRSIIERIKEKGIPTWIIPEELQLTSPTVADLVKELNAKIICCEDKLGNVCVHFQIGAMRAQSALEYFRRVSNKAVITGGDRSDIIFAALKTSTNCVICTGNLQPESSVIVDARKKGVPLLQVRSDTRETLDIIKALPWRLRPADVSKVELAKHAILKHVEWEKLLS